MMFKQDSLIVNHLLTLGKTFDREELNVKILKGLNRSWQPKVTILYELRDFTIMNITTLFSKLGQHQLKNL